MKKVVISTLALVGIALLTPLGSGFVVKNKYRQFYQLASTSTLPVKFQIIEYNQGWFSSDAIVQLTLEAPSTGDFEAPQQLKNFQLELVQKIYHGPIILRDHHPFLHDINRVIFALGAADVVIDQADLQFDFLSVVHYNGGVSMYFDCPHVLATIDPERGLKFALQGLQGSVEMNRQVTHTAGKFTLNTLDLTRKEGEQHVKNARFAYQLDKDALNLWHGKRDLNIAAITMDNQLVIQGVTLGLHDISVNNKFSSTLYTNITDVKLDNKDYGSQQLSLHLDDIDAIALKNLGEKAAEIENKNLPTSAMVLELFPHAVELLQKGFSIHLSPLALNTSWGAIKGEAHINVPTNTEQNPSLDTLMNNITANAKIKFPAAVLPDLFEVTADDVQRWQLAGWLIADGDQFSAQFTFKENQLQINGKMLKIPVLSISTDAKGQVTH